MPILLYNTSQPEFSSLNFDEVVLGAARGGDLHRYLFLLPGSRMIRETERKLVHEFSTTSGLPMENIPLHSFDGFIAQFYRGLESDRRDVTPEVGLALMRTAMQRVSLEYYGREGSEPSLGVVERIYRVISGVRADGIMPSEFDKDIEYAEAHRDNTAYDIVKLRDLHNIYSEYLRLLNTRWIDAAGRTAHVNTALFRDMNAAFRRAFPNTHTLLVNEFSEFTQPQIAMLAQLGMVDGLNVMVYFDYAKENGPLYGNFEETYAKLTTAGFRSLDLDPLATDIPEEERRPFRHHMRKNLFRTDDRIENDSFDHLMDVFGFFNREEEAQGIAALVKSIVIDDGIAPERICITTFGIDRYSDALREHLAEHGIPAMLTTPQKLSRNSLLTSILATLAIPAGSYDRRDVMRAITSPYLTFGPAVDAPALAEASARLRIQRGRLAWARRLQQRIEYLRPRMAVIDDDDDRRSVTLELETLERALASFNALETLLAPFDRRMTPTEFRSELLRLVAVLQTPRNTLALRDQLNARARAPHDYQRVHDELEHDTRALAAFMRLLDEMTEFFEVGAAAGFTMPPAHKAAEGEVPEPVRYPLEFYIDNLRAAATTAPYRLREKHDYGVLVAPISAMQGLEFDVVIVCGLVDGEFPSTYIPETFLGKPLPDAQDRQLRRERVQFYTAVTSCTRRLVLTYPRFAGNSAHVRSSFLDALLRITTLEQRGRVVEIDELRTVRDRIRRGNAHPERIAFLAPIATPDALAEEAGVALWNDGEVPGIADASHMLQNLRHTVGVERSRERGDAAEFMGSIGAALTAEERETLARRRTQEYSPSQLELYARCPFKFFARRVVGAVAPASFDVSLTPLERGLLLHSVLFRLYTELRDSAQLPITGEQTHQVLERARELAREEIAGIVFDHPYWRIDQERILGSEALDGLLEHWINADAERTDSEKSKLTPEFFEVSFGGRGNAGARDAELSSDAAMEIHDLRVRGKVDRVEIYRSGDEIYFVVADYKTGQPPSRTDIRDGTSLQLMIYLEVIRHMLAARYGLPVENVKPVGGIYYRLDARRVEAETRALFVPNEVKNDLMQMRSLRSDPETVEDLVELVGTLFTKAVDYVEQIAQGEFRVTTHDVNIVCRGCEYHAVCRVGGGSVPA